jgi:hypothetical protein
LVDVVVVDATCVVVVDVTLQAAAVVDVIAVGVVVPDRTTSSV